MTITETIGTTATPMSAEREHRLLEAALDYGNAVNEYQAGDPAPSSGEGTHEEKLARMRNLLLAAGASPDHIRMTGLIMERDRLLQEQRDLNDAKDAAQITLRRIASELNLFKEQVVEVATRYAEDNGWCSVIDDALRELGLVRKAKKYEAALTITVTFIGELGASNRDTPRASWIRDSISNTYEIQRAIEAHFELDSDHDGSEVTDVQFEVTSVRDLD